MESELDLHFDNCFTFSQTELQFLHCRILLTPSIASAVGSVFCILYEYDYLRYLEDTRRLLEQVLASLLHQADFFFQSQALPRFSAFCRFADLPSYVIKRRTSIFCFIVLLS